MNEEKFKKYLGIANHDIQVANDTMELKSYVASILYEIDNLQFKIDKANKILDKHFQDDEGIVYKITGEHVAERNEKFIEELRDILKEDK